ncbi:MAG: UDP-glucose/GDP-mannose dehydrogenase family protein [Chloroflexi bacterium]|nr:UDP-glucose/GDP-mannose dehydrogenase family protein [Chloroflexota bacterium]
MANVSVVGTGYVGLVTGACFADLGNYVICLDIDQAKIARLQLGHLPIYEPGLEEVVARNLAGGRLRFTTLYEEALAEAQFIFIAVNTPSGPEGEADMSDVRRAAESIGRSLRSPAIVLNKSTMPIGAGDWVAGIIARSLPEPLPFAVVSNPEFLREGSAVHDFFNPDRIVLGSTDPEAAERAAELYKPLKAPIIVTDLRTAEMVKYASNAFLATKISFINEIASICERLGADVKDVALGMGLDKRIGRAFLEAGVGYGGSCFPKDVKALEYMGAVNGCHPQLLRAVIEINRDARRSVLQKVRAELGRLDEKLIGILGLSFKPNTDDVREAPALEIIHLLRTEGARIRVYDPAASARAVEMVRGVEFCAEPYAAAEGAHALVLVTEWNEFKQLDMDRVRRSMAFPLLVDGRNLYDPQEMARLGFIYRGMGRPAPAPEPSRAAIAE